MISNQANDLYKPIEVDMVLDVGNSRTCGILIEDHPQENDGLRRRYELELRDLSHPEHVYREAFESRIEFAQASFGKDHFSAQSGRNDAFLWPTIARIGHEAARLASLRRGTEGATCRARSAICGTKTALNLDGASIRRMSKLKLSRTQRRHLFRD